MSNCNIKHKVMSVNDKKKSFVYRMQGSSGMWLNYYADFDGFYLSIPNEVAESINKEISAKISPDYKLHISEDYESSSFGVKLYDLKEKAKEMSNTNGFPIVDIAVKFSEYTFGKKVGLSKSVLEFKAGTKKQTMLGADDYFDEIDENGVSEYQPAPEQGAQQEQKVYNTAPMIAGEDKEDDLPF